MHRTIIILLSCYALSVLCKENEGLKQTPGQPVSKNNVLARMIGDLDLSARRSPPMQTVDCGHSSFCQAGQSCCLGRFCCPGGTDCCQTGSCCYSGTTCCGNQCCQAGQQCCGHMCCSGQCCSAGSCCPRGSFCCGNGSCCPHGSQCYTDRTCRSNSGKRSFIAAIQQTTA